MGTPDFAVPILRALAKTGHQIVAVYCQPPRNAGRGQKNRLSPVHLEALEQGYEVRTPTDLQNKNVQKLDIQQIDVLSTRLTCSGRVVVK